MGFPIWNVFEIQLNVCVLYWKMYGFAEAIIFHMEKELSESRNCEAKQELKDPEAFQRNEFWRNSIFWVEEREGVTGPEIG